MLRSMNLTELQKAYADYYARDEALVARQEASTSDRQRFELEQMRRFLLVRLTATIQGEFTRDFIGEVERASAGQQRAA